MASNADRDGATPQTYPPIMLSGIAGGALEERWQLELERVLQNIADPNTDAKKARVITLKVTIKPTEERNVGDVTIEASSKVSAQKSVATLIYMGRTAKGVQAVEHSPLQLTFDPPPPTPWNRGKAD